MLEKCNDSVEEEANITEIESEFSTSPIEWESRSNWCLEAIGESPVKTHAFIIR